MSDASRAKLLLVEDSSANRELLRSILKPMELELVEATNGEEGVEAAQTQDFDMILMDVMMPVMDGVKATKALRALGGRFSRIPIVGLTANNAPEQIASYRQAGMDEVLTKPIDPVRLVRSVFYWASRSAEADVVMI